MKTPKTLIVMSGLVIIGMCCLPCHAENAPSMEELMCEGIPYPEKQQKHVVTRVQYRSPSPEEMMGEGIPYPDTEVLSVATTVETSAPSMEEVMAEGIAYDSDEGSDKQQVEQFKLAGRHKE